MKYINPLACLVISCCFSSTASAGFWDDVKETASDAATAASNATDDAMGDWCSGKKYLFGEMKNSERLNEGIQALNQEIEKLYDVSSKLLYDMENHIDRTSNDTLRNYERRAKDTISLCERAKENNFLNIPYNGIVLKTKDNVLAQFRVNMSSYRASKDTVSYFQKVRSDYSKLDQRIRDKANEITIIKQAFQNLKDPTGNDRSVSNLESTIQNGCVSIKRSEELMMGYSKKDPKELFRDAAENRPTSSISHEEVNDFLLSCREENL